MSKNAASSQRQEASAGGQGWKSKKGSAAIYLSRGRWATFIQSRRGVRPKAALRCHTDRHAIKEITASGLIWSEMMETWRCVRACRTSMEWADVCVFIFCGGETVDLLERETATRRGVARA